jgi:uncharacterized protein YndB with AHSA1/START domain
MAQASRSRIFPAPPQEVWELISDPHHMPRWWPGVLRMEAVTEDAFTQVFRTRKGRSVRLDFRVIASEPPHMRAWEQEIAGTPFERVLGELIIQIDLESTSDGGTEVTITQSQKLRGYSRTGGFMLKRATRARLSEALDGLERIFVPA